MTENEITVEQETIVGGATYEAGENITIEGNVISAIVPDVSDFITNTVDNLVNYYTKSETYTQAEVNSLINAITTMNILVVETLPTEQISTTTIYLVPKTTSQTNNVYDEYIYVSSNWEKIGDTQIDLSNYITSSDLSTALASYTTTTDLTTLLSGKQDTLTAGDNITITNNVISASGGSSTPELVFAISKAYSVNDVKLVFDSNSKNAVKQYIKDYVNNNKTIPIFMIKSSNYYNPSSYNETYYTGYMRFGYKQAGSNNYCFYLHIDGVTPSGYSSSNKIVHIDTVTTISYNSSTDVFSFSDIYTYLYKTGTAYDIQTIYSTEEPFYKSLAFLTVNNTKEYTPTSNYNPATKKYVDDKLTTISGYDATKTQTLKNVNGTLTWVDD